MPGRNRWRSSPITPTPGGSGVGSNWMPGYQERNKESLLEILGGVEEMAEEVAKVRPETWRAVTQMISTTGKVFGTSQAIGQIQNQLAMPARVMTSQLMFGLEGQMIPITNMLRQSTAQINQFIREQQAKNPNAALVGQIAGSLIGAYFGGPVGMAIGGTAGGLIGAVAPGPWVPDWLPESIRNDLGLGDGNVYFIATPDDEGIVPPDNYPVPRNAPMSVKAMKRYGMTFNPGGGP